VAVRLITAHSPALKTSAGLPAGRIALLANLGQWPLADQGSHHSKQVQAPSALGESLVMLISVVESGQISQPSC